MECRGLWDGGDEENKETRDSDLRLKDWENLWIMSLDSTGKEAAGRWSDDDRVEDILKVDWTP
jgi:hypothetical protein